MYIDETPLIRPVFSHYLTNLYKWDRKSITAVICERDTLNITRLCLESLLRFYPDLPILFVDGGSTDGSLEYLQLKALQYPNIAVWERGGRNGHGTMLDEAIRTKITSKFILLLDSDIICMRGGWIEDMLKQMISDNIYAIGALMYVTLSGEGCGLPKDEDDVLRYAHPHCTMINRGIYLNLPPFVEHGAPLCFNMIEAQRVGLKVVGYPVDQHVIHLSGASWCDPKPVWEDDMGVIARPFISFIASNGDVLNSLRGQADPDFELIPLPLNKTGENIFIYHGYKEDGGYRSPGTGNYHIRFKVHGDYICPLEGITDVPTSLVREAKKLAIKFKLPDEFGIDGYKFIKRTIWQKSGALI